MMKFVRSFWLMWFLALTAFYTDAAHGVEYQCARELMIRSVTIKYEEPGQQVPCEVVYHKPPHNLNVLWRAQAQAGFCESRAEELVRTLERGGWSCEQIQVPTPIDAPEASARPARPDNEPGVHERARPAEAVTVRSDQASAPLERRKVEPAARAVEAPPSEETSRPKATATTLEGNRSEWSARLEVALARDLHMLEDGSGNEVQAGSPGFGDLNGDGQLDAAVLITFASGGTDHLQYLVAYVYGQDAYRLVASRFIGGSYREVFSGELEAIEDGMIALDLRVLEPRDTACCPSGSRKATFALGSGELTRVEEATATATP